MTPRSSVDFDLVALFFSNFSCSETLLLPGELLIKLVLLEGAFNEDMRLALEYTTVVRVISRVTASRLLTRESAAKNEIE